MPTNTKTFYQQHLIPYLRKRFEWDAGTQRDMQERYRELCRSRGFVALCRTSPRVACARFMDEVEVV